jgi:hypothetical protein
VIGPDGTIAAFLRLEQGEFPPQNVFPVDRSAIYLGSGGPWQRVVGTGDAPLGAPSRDVATGESRRWRVAVAFPAAAGDAPWVVAQGTLWDDSFGAEGLNALAPVPFSYPVIFAGAPGRVRVVAHPGKPVVVAPGDVRRIPSTASFRVRLGSELTNEPRISGDGRFLAEVPVEAPAAAGLVRRALVMYQFPGPGTNGFAVHPSSGAAAAGSTLRLEAVAVGATSLQWYRNGVAIPGATGPLLEIPHVQAAQAGRYSVLMESASGPVESDVADISVFRPAADPATTSVNIATRALVGSGDDVMIPGFVISGSGTKRMLIRAVGPRLADFGLSGVLEDPVMDIVRTRSVEGVPVQDLVATNDDWQSGDPQIAGVGATVGAFPLDGTGSGGTLDTRSAAVLVDLEPGAYTAVTRGKNGGTGVGIVEVYAVSGTARVVNLANRGFVGTGDQVMIPGFVVQGGGPRTYLVRAVGPTLATFGVGGVLANPQLQLVRIGTPNTTVAVNDDWSSDAAAQADVASVGATVGAFPLPAGSADAALVVTLEPGVYTAVVSGVGDATGVVLVEVYEVP